eukprot:13303662-Heterocapsa_arctica.AAC.1
MALYSLKLRFSISMSIFDFDFDFDSSCSQAWTASGRTPATGTTPGSTWASCCSARSLLGFS